MAVAPAEIVQFIPYLRRYARALTGSQVSGDEYVRVGLELILEEPQRLQPDEVKLDLFKAFHDAWRVLQPVGADAEAADDDRRPWPDRDLASLPPIERQALLLVCLEEFSHEQAATILSVSEVDVRGLVAQAREDIRRQSAAPILVIEDEPMIAMELTDLVEDMGHIVCGQAATEHGAIELANRLKPALILADIRLRDDESGITAVQQILKNLDVPVIFVTGYPERLLTGETPEPAYVIPKPFDPDMLRAAIGQALSIKKQKAAVP